MEDRFFERFPEQQLHSENHQEKQRVSNIFASFYRSLFAINGSKLQNFRVKPKIFLNSFPEAFNGKKAGDFRKILKIFVKNFCLSQNLLHFDLEKMAIHASFSDFA